MTTNTNIPTNKFRVSLYDGSYQFDQFETNDSLEEINKTILSKLTTQTQYRHSQETLWAIIDTPSTKGRWPWTENPDLRVKLVNSELVNIFPKQ